MKNPMRFTNVRVKRIGKWRIVAEQLAAQIADVPALAPYAEGIGLGVVVIVITYFSLIIGELVPKRIALNNPEKSPR